jgi:hypothetical protein
MERTISKDSDRKNPTAGYGVPFEFLDLAHHPVMRWFWAALHSL